MDPPVDGDVINVDPSLSEEFLDIAIGQPVAGVLAHRQQGHFGREPVAGKRSGFSRAGRVHAHTLAASDTLRQCNSAFAMTCPTGPGRSGRPGLG